MKHVLFLSNFSSTYKNIITRLPNEFPLIAVVVCWLLFNAEIYQSIENVYYNKIVDGFLLAFLFLAAFGINFIVLSIRRPTSANGYLALTLINYIAISLIATQRVSFLSCSFLFLGIATLSFAIHDLILKLISSFVVLLISVSFCFLTKVELRIVSWCLIFIGICGAVFFLRNSMRKLIFMKVSFSPNLTLFAISISVAAFALSLATLNQQPILDWDSSVVHLPAIANMVANNSFAPDYFNVQTFFPNLYHVAALPFYAVANDFGLRFFNTATIFLIAYLFIKLAQRVSTQPLPLKDELLFLVILSVVSIPMIHSTAATFQYDFPLTFFLLIIIILVSDNRITHSPTSSFFLGVTIACGAGVKATFIIIAFPFICYFIYLNRKQFVNLVILLMPVFIFGVTVALRNYELTKDFLFPYDYFAKISSLDPTISQSKYFSNKFLDFIFLLPLTSLKSSNFGQYYNFSGGFLPLFAFFCMPFCGRLKILNLSKATFFSFLSLLFLCVQTFYLRYLFPGMLVLVFLLSLTPFITQLSEKFKKVSAIFLTVMILLQLSLTTNLNWWLYLRGDSFRYGYTEQSVIVKLRDPNWSELTDLSDSVGNATGLLVSKKFAENYFWLNRLEKHNIKPWTWQAGFECYSLNSQTALNNSAELFNISYFLVPVDESDLMDMIKNQNSFIRNTQHFALYKTSQDALTKPPYFPYSVNSCNQ